MRVSTSALLATAQNIATYCAPENNGVCFSMHVPTGSTGDLYMQITGPSSIPWVGLGQSTSGMMAGSNIFVIYPDQDGGNVTLSQRAGLGHFPPKPEKASGKLTLLAGSGIMDGRMVANVHCSDCNTWMSGGAMSLDDAKSMWIYAYGPAHSKNIRNSSTAALINFHDGFGSFRANLQAATGPDALPSSSSSSSATSPSANPFLNRAIPSSSTKSSTHQESWSDGLKIAKESRVRLAHAVLGGLAFGLIFPLGAVLMRLGVAGCSTWKIHAGLQLLAWAMSVAVMGMGIWLARNLYLLDTPHAILGLFVVAGLSLLPILGWLQHAGYVRTGRRTLWGYVHAYAGRALVLMGVVNFPLGLEFAKPYKPVPVRKGDIAYGTLVGVIGVAWIAIVALTAWKRRRAGNSATVPGEGTGQQCVRGEKVQDVEVRAGSVRTASGSESDASAAREKPQ